MGGPRHGYELHADPEGLWLVGHGRSAHRGRAAAPGAQRLHRPCHGLHRKVQDENRFRYMCGVAWRKVGDMNKAARRIASGDAPADDEAGEADSFEDGRLSLARELLDEISEEERAHFLEIADMTGWQDEDDEPQTESQHACEAVSSLLNSARCNVDWLVERLEKTFKRLPPEIGKPCLAEMGEDTGISDPLSRLAWRGVNALFALEDLIDLPALPHGLTDYPKPSGWSGSTMCAPSIPAHTSAMSDG